MKVYKELEQGSEEWLIARLGKITGTRSKGLFVDSDTLKIDLLIEKYEDFNSEENYTSTAMERGSEMEPLALMELSKELFIDFKTFGFVENGILGISPDGLTEDLKIACEIKCPLSKKHMNTILSDEIPLDNINQCIHYFAVIDSLEKLYFCSYRPENKKKSLFIKELTRESEVNIGTKVKPKLKKISELVEFIKDESKKIEQWINEN